MATKQDRLDELEMRFSKLESQISDAPVKETLSLLHAMIQENRRELLEIGQPIRSSEDQSFNRIANLYKSAPGMEGAAENSGLPIGSKAPDFSLPDSSGKYLSLKDFKGKNVVLVFYPLDWSPACSDQLSLYQSELAEFEKYNAQVIAISVDSFYSHGAWSTVRGITFPLLADFHPKGEVAKRYKVWRETNGFTERALYIIDASGTIRSCTIAPEIYKIPDVYELFDQLKSIQK